MPERASISVSNKSIRDAYLVVLYIYSVFGIFGGLMRLKYRTWNLATLRNEHECEIKLRLYVIHVVRRYRSLMRVYFVTSVQTKAICISCWFHVECLTG